MQSQLGMITPFFHKAPCGGNIKQALAPEQTGAYAMAHTPALKYKCIGCNEFVEPEDVVEKAGDYKKGEKAPEPKKAEPKKEEPKKDDLPPGGQAQQPGNAPDPNKEAPKP